MYTDSIFDLIHYCETRKEGYNIFYSFVLCLVEYVVFTWKPLFHSNLLLSSVISRSSLGEPKVRIVFMRHFFCQLIQSHKYDKTKQKAVCGRSLKLVFVRAAYEAINIVTQSPTKWKIWLNRITPNDNAANKGIWSLRQTRT